MIEILEQEVKEAGDIWAGCINNTGVMPGGEVRAILENVNEVQNMHPVIEDTEKTYASAAKEGGEDSDSHNFTEHYKFPEKRCTYWNCPVHFGNFRKNIPWEKQWCILGESLSHPKVVRMGKLRKMKKLVDYSTISLMSLEMMDSMSKLDSSAPHYYDKSQ
jgi:hypothetical protein